MKKWTYGFLIILLLAICLFPQKEVSAGQDSYYETIDGVLYLLYDENKALDTDAYAIIEEYYNAQNVVDGVYTIPTEVTFKGKKYPVAGVNGGYSELKGIKEVIVPKEFGSKEVKTDYYAFEKKVGGSSFFTVPNVEKVTIDAEKINLTDLYSDAGYLFDKFRENQLHGSVLKELNIQSKKVTMGQYTLADMPALETVQFNKDAQVTLKKYSIVNCSKLANLTFPAKTKFTEGAISLCNNLNKVDFMEGSDYTVKNGVISATGTLLFAPANATTYQTAADVKRIGDLAFSNCSKLKSVTLGVKSIGEYALYHCKDLTSVKLGKALERIQSYAFALCNLKSLEIPKTVKSIGHGIVYKNGNLSSIKTAGSYFKMQNGALTTKSGKTLIAAIPQKGAVNIPSGVAYMRGMPVSNPPVVTAIKFPTSLRTFYQMGQKMPKLTKITFTSKVVPEAKDLDDAFKDKGVWDRGYPQPAISASTSGKLVIDVPDDKKQKQSYKKFIKEKIRYRSTCIIK